MRARRWTSDPVGIVSALRQMATPCLPTELVTRLWRFFCCARCTTSHFAPEVKPFEFCKALEADAQHHHALRPEARSWLTRCGFDVSPSGEEVPAWLSLGCVGAPARAVRTVAALDALASMYEGALPLCVCVCACAKRGCVLMCCMCLCRCHISLDGHLRCAALRMTLMVRFMFVLFPGRCRSRLLKVTPSAS